MLLLFWLSFTLFLCFDCARLSFSSCRCYIGRVYASMYGWDFFCRWDMLLILLCALLLFKIGECISALVWFCGHIFVNSLCCYLCRCQETPSIDEMRGLLWATLFPLAFIYRCFFSDLFVQLMFLFPLVWIAVDFLIGFSPLWRALSSTYSLSDFLPFPSFSSDVARFCFGRVYSSN